MAAEEEIREKERRVRNFLHSRGFEALLLKRQANFSWMTCGGLNVVGLATELGAAALLITMDAKYVISNNIEAARMIAEEDLGGQGFAGRSYPWYEEQETAIVKSLVPSGIVGSDVPSAGAVNVAEDIARLRYSLTPEEVERYRWLGENVSAALERTLMETRRGEKECEVVGRLCRELWQDRIDPVLLMAAADSRVAQYRHPIPTERPIERYFMLSVNARKWGLIVSTTRFVHFGGLPAELEQKYRANVEIDCTFMAATRPGVPAREVLQKGIEAYRAKGYPDEWRLHHQGGALGYVGRDYRTGFNTADVIEENQAFTWNPSITATKSEDTILATSRGPEMITRPVLFPTLEVDVDGASFVRPAMLRLL